MKDSKNRFKSKAESILKSSPQSIKEFLEEPSESQKSEKDVQLHTCAKLQTHNAPAIDEASKSYVRLHVHIREDLSDKLLEVVFQRKKGHKTQKEASQRAIIEEALEMYFQRII